jgi:hypothetical protein
MILGDFMERETEKKKEQAQSTVHRLVEVLETHGYWVWSISRISNPDGLITLAVSPDRKN